MLDYLKSTDAVHRIKLPSAIEQACWGSSRASVGDEVLIEVFTAFVGDGSEIKIRINDRSGRFLGESVGKVYANRFRGTYVVTENARDAIYFEAELPKHNLKKRSEDLTIVPPVRITNAKWSQERAQRGEIIGISADVEGAPTGTEALIEIYEYDADGAHDFVTKMGAIVKNQRIQAQWQFQYFDDTDDIPTAEESERGYNPPEYFFKVTVGSAHATSGLLQFRDWAEIELKDENGKPLAGQEYVLKLPDGSERKGRLDARGQAVECDLPPGKYRIEFPKAKGLLGRGKEPKT